jgi:hypothetical protein
MGLLRNLDLRRLFSVSTSRLHVALIPVQESRSVSVTTPESAGVALVGPMSYRKGIEGEVRTMNTLHRSPDSSHLFLYYFINIDKNTFQSV